MPEWFKNLPVSFWRALILKALGAPQAQYDPAALDKIIGGHG